MGLSISNLTALRSFPPSSLLENTFDFFEFLRYGTKELRDQEVFGKDELLDLFSKQSTLKIKKRANQKKAEIKKEFDIFSKKLDQILFFKDSKEEISEIKWNKIDDFTNLLRLVERSDERKIRWALYHLFSSGKKEFSNNELNSILSDFKITNIPKILQKIIKNETSSGLDATYDGSIFKINHVIDDKLVGHYLCDAIEELSRRSPGELEDEILNLLDEGSYSNQEMGKILSVDDAMVSRTMSRLRDKEKIVLSSFGDRGIRFYTTNCENCPFGTTKDSCKKESLSYIITSLHEDYDITLTANDFDDIQTNQALLSMKRIFMMARKEKNTKLEQNLNENLAKLLSSIVEHALNVKSPSKTPEIPQIKIQVKPILSNLPSLYQLGLFKGAKSGISLMDDLLRLATKSIKKEERLKIRKHAIEETNKFLKDIGIS